MNINEAFEQAFASRKAAYQDNQFEVLFAKLQEQHNELECSMTILDEAVRLQNNLELLYERGGAGNAETGKPYQISGGESSESGSTEKGNEDAESREKKKESQETGESDRKYEGLRKEVSNGIDNIMKLLSKKPSTIADPRSESAIGYQPVTGFAIDKSLGDLSFPQNIIHFVKTLITWIKNLILFAIKGIRNIIKNLFGSASDDEKEEVHDLKKKLKLSFKKTQLFKVMGTPITVDRNRATGS